MGNPHCVVFVENDSVFKLPDEEFARLGRQFERHPFFPRGVNTEFILPVSAGPPAYAGMGARLGRDSGLRHGRLRGGSGGGTDRPRRSRARRSSCAAAPWKSNGATARMRTATS